MISIIVKIELTDYWIKNQSTNDHSTIFQTNLISTLQDISITGVNITTQFTNRYKTSKKKKKKSLEYKSN